jgi:hypothetical protein
MYIHGTHVLIILGIIILLIVMQISITVVVELAGHGVVLLVTIVTTTPTMMFINPGFKLMKLILVGMELTMSSWMMFSKKDFVTQDMFQPLSGSHIGSVINHLVLGDKTTGTPLICNLNKIAFLVITCIMTSLLLK